MVLAVLINRLDEFVQTVYNVAMTEIRFYHVTRGSAQEAMAQILEKAHERGLRSLVYWSDKAKLKRLDRFLWTYRADSFLPHSMNGDSPPEDNPIWLTTEEKNGNRANMLVLCDAEKPSFMDDFELVVCLFEDNDTTMRNFSRQLWKDYTDKDGIELVYWQQDDSGRWQKK